MRTKLWHYFKTFLALWVLFNLFHRFEHQSFAQSVSRDSSYFNGNDLDYWREGKKVKPFLPELSSVPNLRSYSDQPSPSGSIIRQGDSRPFDWKNYEDPKSPEFWDDGGDYVAPRPLREAVARPTPENLEKYANWQAKRLVVIAEFNQKLMSRQASPGTESAGKEKSAVSRSQPAAEAYRRNLRNLNEVSLMYFYQTSCSHCQAEKDKVERLRRLGVCVTFVQMDADENPPLHLPSVLYSAVLSKQLGQFGITATPTWIFRGASAD